MTAALRGQFALLPHHCPRFKRSKSAYPPILRNMISTGSAINDLPKLGTARPPKGGEFPFDERSTRSDSKAFQGIPAGIGHHVSVFLSWAVVHTPCDV